MAAVIPCVDKMDPSTVPRLTQGDWWSDSGEGNGGEGGVLFRSLSGHPLSRPLLASREAALVASTPVLTAAAIEVETASQASDEEDLPVPDIYFVSFLF